MERLEGLLLVGPTGSGKTPLGNELERRGILGRRAHHFDFGANLRAVTNSQLPLPEEDVALIKQILSEGRLLKPEEFYLAENILSAFLSARNFTPADLLILNGLPRNHFQAERLLRTVKINKIVFLTVEISVLRERLKLDPAGDRKGRTDDSEEYLIKKLEWFHRETLPMVHYLKSRGTSVFEIQVEPEDTGNTLYDKLMEKLR